MASRFTDKVTAKYAGARCFNALKIDNSSLINGYNDISTKSQYLCHNYFTFQIMLDSIPMTIFGQNYIAVNPRKSRHLRINLTLSNKPLPQWCRVTILAGGGVVRDTKPYLPTEVLFFFCYKFNSTDEFSESWGCSPPHPPHSTPLPYPKIIFVK